MRDNHYMTRRRFILFGLLVVAVVMTAGQIIQPSAGLEYLCIIFVVPVVVVNSWEWFEPEIMEKLFGKGEDKGRGDDFEI